MSSAVLNCPVCGSLSFNLVVKSNGDSYLICTDCDADILFLELDSEFYEYALDSKEEAKREK